MGKFVVVFLTEVFIILPIFATRFHGHDSYKQYYENRVNGGLLKNPTSTFYEITKESHYDSNKDNSKHASKNSFGSPDIWQARNGGNNYAGVTHCDHMGQTFCEDDPSYPQDLVNQILAKNSSLLHYAHKDIIAIEPRLDDEETPLCLSREQLIYPRTALNQQNKWLHILQANESDFYQAIRIEICIEPGAKCKIIDDFIETYVTMCKQKYIYRQLSAISESGEVISDYFKLPASCCCHVQFKPE